MEGFGRISRSAKAGSEPTGMTSKDGMLNYFSSHPWDWTCAVLPPGYGILRINATARFSAKTAPSPLL